MCTHGQLFITIFLKRSSVLAFSFATIGLALYPSSSIFSVLNFGLPMVGLAFLSATLNGYKTDIGLSTTPFKLASIFVHMYFVWILFASQNGPGPS